MATWAKGIDFKNTNNTARIGGVGAYGTDSTVQKLYFGLGTEPWNNAGLQLTSSSINFKGNKIYHAGDKPTASEIGAAPSSHTHSYLPLSGGTVTTSSFGPFAIERSGSTHGASICFKNSNGILGYVGMQGGVNSGLKRWSADTNTMYTILDSGNYKDTITPANIGAAASSHTHNYIPLTGGTFTGNVRIESSAPLFTIKNTGGADTSIIFDRGSNANWRIRNTSGNLLFESDYASSKGSYYTGLTLNYNSGNLTAKGEIYANGGNRVYHTGNKPTPADIGAAASSHTHSYLPLSGGTITNANFGPLVIERSGSTNASSIYFKNSNGILGAIGMSGEVNSGLKRWSADTKTAYTFLDTGNYKNTITPANIGAAASSHSHSYLPISGGTLTGDLNMSKASPSIMFSNSLATANGNQMQIKSNSEGSLQIGLYSTKSDGPVNPFTVKTNGNLYTSGNLFTFNNGGVWKSIDLYRDDSNGRQGYARYGIGGNSNGPSPSIEFHTNFNSTKFQSRIDLNSNSLALVVQGDNTGDQSSWLGFYSGGSSASSNRVGYVGRGSAGNSNIVLLSDKGSVQIRSAYQTNSTGVIADNGGYFRPETSNGWACGSSSYRWSTVYYTNLNAASDKHLKENITYIPKDDVATVSTFTKEKDSIITENDLYNFVKNDLSLATYDYKTSLLLSPNEEDKLKNKIGFIAQDIKDTKIGKIFIKSDEVEETPDVIGGDVAEREDEVIDLPRIMSEDVKEIYSYDLTDYVNILAGALKVAMNKIEELENKLENLTDNNN